jgi:D-glycero-D-manno-heptose 1,7-bisphosphate phosphatase
MNEKKGIRLTKPYFVFDRDGTLIEHIPYLSKLSDIKYMDGVFETLARLAGLGFRFGIITNQSVIARNIATRDKVDEINNEISNFFKVKSRIEFDFIQVCPHLPSDQCMCRKPKPQLMYEVIKIFQIDCEKSFMVGDSESDIWLGKEVGFRTILIQKDTKLVKTQADYVVSKFTEILTIF